MDFLGINKRKDKKKALENERRKEKEIQAKVRIRHSLIGMKNQSAKMEKFKKDYIDKARNAVLINNKQTYNLAKQGLKMCLSKQRFLDSMIANFEIAFQMNEMNKIVNSFVGGMNLLSNEMKDITSALDISKAQEAYETALANNENQYEALDAFLKEAESSLESYNGNENEISDDEIDTLINNQAVDKDSDIDDEIEKKINDIKSKMNS